MVPPVLGFAINKGSPPKSRRLPSCMLPSYARYALDSATVQDLLKDNHKFAKADVTVANFVEQWVEPGQNDYVIVGEDGQLVGTFSLTRLRFVSKDSWPKLAVGSLARRRGPTADPSTPIDDVLEEMADNLLDVIPVVDAATREFLGVISSKDAMTLMVEPEGPPIAH